MAKFSSQTRDLSRRVSLWTLAVALVFTVIYAAAAIVFSNVASAPLADAIAEVVAPWEYVPAEDVDDATHEKYEQHINLAKADVMRSYMMYAANDAGSDAGNPLYSSREAALAAGGSPADRVAQMNSEEICALAAQAPDVSAAVSPETEERTSADGVKIDGATFAAASVALARSEDFAQARERGLALSSDLSFDGGLSTTDWMRDVIRMAFDLRNAGVAGRVYDGIYRITIGWGKEADLVNTRYEDYLSLGKSDMSEYLVASESSRDGIAYELYYGDGHEEVRDLSTYVYLRSLREPLFVIGWLVGLLIVVRRGTRKAFGYFDQLHLALASAASGKTSVVEKLPDELAETRRVVEDIERREDVARREAQLTERRKNELVAYLAHDTKTPLTSVIGYLSILSEEPDLPEGQRQRYLSAALEKSYRLDGMIDEFFEIARFNITTLSVERAWCDPAVLCFQVAGELFPTAEERGITIDVHADEGSRAFVDAAQLSRALSNVLKNAVSYADEGTSVTVTLDVEDAASKSGDTTTSEHPSSPVMRITVTNEGSEISAEHLERIFEKFYREDAARATERGGAGLGLAIAREIVQAHGGTIAATSSEGRTTFTIEVPAGL